MSGNIPNDKTVRDGGSTRPGSGGIPQIPDHELLRCIGSGAFGEVWLARNALGGYRAVKIVYRKTFRDTRTFEREFSGLQRFEPVSREHEGFVDVLHVGRNDAAGLFYYVMELADDDLVGQDIRPQTYVPKTLFTELARRSKLPFDECVQLGLSLADALDHLHSQGLVHRDIKPLNIIFVRGVPKLADIGLVAEAGQRTFVGTEGYIPPEGQGSTQADLYSLGKVLQETAFGQGELTDRERMLPLNAVIQKACAGDVKARYRTAQEMYDSLMQLLPGTAPANRQWKRSVMLQTLAGIVALIILAWVAHRFAVDRNAPPPTGAAGSGPVRSLAVLPLANYSGDTNQDFFADGMTETLIGTLTQIRALEVRSRTSVGQYKGTQKPIPQIAKELHVDTVVEGSVMRVGNQVRITAQLIDAGTDRHLWATNYVRDITDVLRLQADVAQDIAAAVKVALTPQEKLRFANARAVNPAAFDAYLKGRQYWHRFTREGFEKAIEASQEAIRLDPEYAPAYAMLADCYIVMANNELLPPKVGYAKAKEALAKVSALDESSEAVTTQAAIDLFFEWNWASTKRNLDRALELKPNAGSTEELYANYAAAMGHFDEAMNHARRAAELEPLAPMANFAVPYVLYHQRRYNEAIRELRKVRDLFPYLNPAKYALGYAYERNGQYADSIAVFDQAMQSERLPGFLAGLGVAYAGAGRKDEARRIISELEEQYDKALRTGEGYVSPLHLAMIYAALDDKQQALEWLQRGFDGRAFWMFDLKTEPKWDNLRAEPGFEELLKKMNLAGADEKPTVRSH